MKKLHDCIYQNEIKKGEVKNIYECADFIEIEYVKDAIQKTLVIEFYVYGGSMGYGSFFKYSTVELPQLIVEQKGSSFEKTHTKKISDKLLGITTILEMNLYKKSSYGYGDTEELEIFYLNEAGGQESYILDFLSEEEDWFAPRIRKNETPKYEKKECASIEMPRELFSTGVYKEALAFALKAHKEQKTPEGLPYSFHIVSVATEIVNSLSQHTISYDEANIAVCCALLHDLNEDTDVKVSDELHIENIEAVIAGVEALTKNDALPTKQEQMQDSLKRLKVQPKCVQMVKLADRITNLAPAPDFWNQAKRKAYVEEAKQILEALKDSNPYLASKLQYKIENYAVEGNDNFVVFYTQNGVMVLDKNHPKYLKTFKALNRLNSYLVKQYDLKLFDTYSNVEDKGEVSQYKKVGISYIMEVMNSKNLLDLNKQTDSSVEKYFTAVLDGEECFVG